MHDIEWGENDTPISRQFGDPYFSRSDGREETRHVFLGGNDLPMRWRARTVFTVAELGFGTGLNFLETIAAWQRSTTDRQRLIYVAFERYPMAQYDLVRALTRWPDLGDDVGQLTRIWPPAPGWSSHRFGKVALMFCTGDANCKVTTWNGLADAWYLDGFSPAKNPELWGAELMRAVFERTCIGGTFATFTAAGWVRRNLEAAGFDVSKMPGYGRKRECLRGIRTT